LLILLVLFHGKNLVSKKRYRYYTGFCEKREPLPGFSVLADLAAKDVGEH
jgi:hypothetical protein